MKKLGVLVLLAAFLLSTTLESFAGERGVVNHRQAKQAGRVGQGVKSGELTKHEAERLAKQQAHMNRMEQKAKADGKISHGEFVRMQKAQNRMNRHIYRQKHDKQDRN